MHDRRARWVVFLPVCERFGAPVAVPTADPRAGVRDVDVAGVKGRGGLPRLGYEWIEPVVRRTWRESFVRGRDGNDERRSWPRFASW